MIEQLIGQFSPESFSEWCREKFDRFTADPHEVLNAGDFPKARIVGYVQSLPDSDINRPLLVMSVYAGEQISERSSRRKQFDFARKQLLSAIDKPPAKVKGLFTQGLFAFHDNAGNFRLSLVSGRADGKKLVYSDFKRQSFFIRPCLNNKTFRARMESAFGTYGALTAAFSVETLTKEFYNSLFAWYERAMAPESKVTFPNDVNRDDDDRTQLAEHLIRLITRLMFIWFIRQKNLIPDKIFEPAELSKLLKSFDPASPKQDNYYRAILQNLFFATLNCEINERDFANEGDDEEGRKEHYGIKLLYRYFEEFACSQDEVKELFRCVPFLNGGLFECLDKKRGETARSPVIYQDGFSRNPKCVAHIPNNLFFDEHGLITLFSRYDFTVDENDPNDSDVALDPELLGKVFENLLGAYNPETRETARKQSGSFYTPREIVNYMVDESLKAHLVEQCGAGIPACHSAPTFVSPPLDSHLNISHRRLPHWHLDGAIYWVCFRLADSIPLDKLRAWKAERTTWCQSNPEPWNEQQWQDYNRLFGERVEAWLDAGIGSRSLARSDVRDAVTQCLLRFNGERLLVHAAVVMPTHVHVLIEPLPLEMAGKNACPTLPCHSLSELLNGIKGASARAANKILGTTGSSFWMDEAYDHIVRNEKQYRHFLHYIRENPIKAALRTDEYWLYLPDDSCGAGIPACHSNTSINLLFAPDDLPLPFSDAERRDLVTALYHCRILDPACGSGAFPMGLLLKMVHLLQRLDPKNTLWHEVVMAKTEKALTEAESLGKEEKEQRRQRITESFDQSVNHPDYARKLYLIENCIFGVDIQPIAVQIAKLRAFITLVCDQTPDLTDAARNYRMLPLPNLETKFVAANSLIGLSTDFAEGLKPGEGASRLDDHELVRLRAELAEVRHQHFRARNSSDKNACRKRDRELRGKIKTRLVEIACKPDVAKIAFYRAEIEKLQIKRKTVAAVDLHEITMTEDSLGDILASTGSIQTILRVDRNKDKRDEYDAEIRRNTRTIEVEESRAKNKSAFQKEADRVAAWDPYDQSEASPFFDPEWMFGFKSGFNIVIGNPPYVRQESIKDQKPLLKAQNFASFNGTADLFVYFYERGVQFLAPNGHLCFITSNKYLRAGYGKELREYLAAKTCIRQLIDFGDAPVFEAIAYPSIILTQRAKPEASHTLYALTWTPGPAISDFPAVFEQSHFSVPQSSLRSDGWQLERKDVLALLSKLRAAGKSLGEFVNGKFYYGIKTGLNEAFVVDRATRDRLITEHVSSKEILKPFLRGRDIKRWRCVFAEQYLIKIESSENKKHPWSGKSPAEAEKLFAITYPAIHKHLIQYRKGLVKREDQGSYFWELRSCAYWDEFEKPKIVYQEIATYQAFGWDSDDLYATNKVFSLPDSEKWFFGLLNSAPVWWFLGQVVTKMVGGAYAMQWPFVSQIPIPPITSKQATAITALVDRILEAKATNPVADVSELEAQIDRLVYELYGLTNDEIAIVEGHEAGGKKVGQAFLPAQNAQTGMSAPPLKKKPRKSVMTEDPDLA